ncbi:MAG: response regulator [Candidatus Riflebacteria bacterium]|nr:response regulator [Candidatus Riflebacteria bacterium]
MYKILVVEEDLNARRRICSCIEDNHIAAIESPNSRHAWETLKSNDSILMVFISEKSSRVDAKELMEFIALDTTMKNVPVYIMAEVSSPKQIFKLLSYGAAGFIVKPVRLDEVRDYLYLFFAQEKKITESQIQS